MWTHDPASAHGRGFTLIDLVVSVAIVGILLAIAAPSYQSQVRKSARAEARALINNAATRQQQFPVDRRPYAMSLAQFGTPAPADLATKDTFAVATARRRRPSSRRSRSVWPFTHCNRPLIWPVTKRMPRGYPRAQTLHGARVETLVAGCALLASDEMGRPERCVTHMRK